MIRKCAYIFVFVTQLMLFQAFGALNPAALRCLDVKTSGDVELTWVIPGDPTGVFDAFMIYYSTTQAGPYNLIATINVFAQSTYLHVGANAQTQQGFYYMVTRSDAPTYQYSIESDTLATIKLNATNPLNGTAPLFWNALHVPTLATSGNYSVYYEYPVGIWNLSGVSTVNSFIDTIEICNSVINFKIIQPDAMGCFSVSSVDGDIYQNLIPPKVPVLDSVSIDPVSQNAVLGWQSSASGDTEGYIIYEFIGGVWTPIDTVWGIGSTSYENVLSDAANAPESYCIAAIDSCGITSPLTNGQTTMHLTSAVDACARVVQLSWTAYAGFPTGLSRYRVYASENAGPYSLIDSTDAATTSFAAGNLNDGSTYCFFVMAISSSGTTSTSNLACVNVNLPNLPSYVYIRYASVESSGQVMLRWVVDPTVYVKGYSVQRGYSNTGPWLSVDYKTYTGTGDYAFTDVNAGAETQSVYYRVAIIDSCSNEAMYSYTARTIYLQGYAESDLTNKLVWNDYEGWPTGAFEYRLYRMIDGAPEGLPVATFMSGTATHIDDVAAFYLSNGSFSYRLEAIEAPGNPMGFADTTWSNWTSIQQIPRLFIANAFAPEGYNRTFCPLGVYIDHSSYSFIVFNELGEEMFNTQDFYECWDGSNDGAPAPMGVYNYVLHLTLPGGQEFLKRGHITLIR